MIEANHVCNLYADREPGAFRKVPKDTRELYVTMLHSDEASELSLLGQRLKSLRKLILMHGNVEDVDFLESFQSIRVLKCLLHSLKNFSGIGKCVKLTDLILGGSLSTAGNLACLGRLSLLERLRLEGPHPSKGLDEIKPMRTVKALDLYAPKWSLEHVPRIFPAAELLSISQGAYRSLDFIHALDNLAALDIAYARKLTSFDAIGRHPRLRALKIGYAITGLKSCAQFGCSSTVQQIEISSCKNLRNISAFVDWPALRKVSLLRCPGIPLAQVEALRMSGREVKWG
jgi:hypothetical protein